MKIVPCESQQILAKTFPPDCFAFVRFEQLSPGNNHSADCRIRNSFLSRLFSARLPLIAKNLWVVPLNKFSRCFLGWLPFLVFLNRYIICASAVTMKLSMPAFYCGICWDRFVVTLNKPSLCINGVIPISK